MATSTERGHDIKYDGKKWVYSDIELPTAGNPRPCGRCLRPDRPDGHDVCLGELKGLMNACCGHGSAGGAYVQFLDGSTVSGKYALTIQRILRKG